MANIKTTADQHTQYSAKKGRKAAAEITGCSESRILKWTNMADLMKISGVGGEYSRLLEAAGVDRVEDRRNRNAEKLATAMKASNEKKKLTCTAPGNATKGLARVLPRPVDESSRGGNLFLRDLDRVDSAKGEDNRSGFWGCEQPR